LIAIHHNLAELFLSEKNTQKAEEHLVYVMDGISFNE
jgi:hypothetical protein